MRPVLLILCALLMHTWLAAWTPEKWFDAPKSNRVVHYDIKGVLDWKNKKFEGRMKLTWRNTGAAPVQDLPFHLYLNAFRHPDTSYMKANGQKTEKTIESPWGYCEIKSAKFKGNALSGRMGEDETVYWFRLPMAVKPGGSAQVEIDWEVKFPEMQSGSGWTGKYLVASMWYPKIGIYTGDQWVCEPFGANTAFQGDFGNFDVELSLPNLLQLANTGTVTIPLDENGEPMRDGRGTVVEAKLDPDRRLNFIYNIHAEDVTDFSWIAAPSNTWGMDWYHFGDTQVFFYHISKNGSQLGRLKEAVNHALYNAKKYFGTYPYPVLSIVDLPPEAHSAIASPTLALISNIDFDPIDQRVVPEQAAIRQVGDQFFKGLIASNPLYKHAPNDLLSAWFTDRVIEEAYTGLITSKRFFMNSYFPSRHAGWSLSLGSNSFIFPNLFMNNDNNASATVINQLGANLGNADLEKAIRTYYTEMSFKHSSNNDFRRVAEKISGRDLGSFWEKHMEGSGTLDYRIQSVAKTTDTQWTITLERLGSITAPLALWVRLENGQEISHVWDGEEKQIAYTFESPIAAASLDPECKYPSMKCRMYATYSAKPTTRGLQYWAQNIFGAIGGFLQGIGVG